MRAKGAAQASASTSSEHGGRRSIVTLAVVGGAAKIASDLFAMAQTQATTLGYGEAALITAIVSAILAPLALLMGHSNPGAGAAAAA
jgi:hypothetical protein